MSNSSLVHERSERNERSDFPMRYYPRSFKDVNNNQIITKTELIQLLKDNLTFKHCYCISEHVFDQRSINPYFDFDILHHSSEEKDIIRTLEHIKTKLIEVLSPIARKTLDISLSKVFKFTTKHEQSIPKLSIHAIVCNGVQMSPLGLYYFVRDNAQILSDIGADLVVYPKQSMSHKKFRCVNTCKEGESIECMLLPYTNVDDLGKHLIQCEYDPEQFVDYKPKNDRMHGIKRQQNEREEEQEEREHKKTKKIKKQKKQKISEMSDSTDSRIYVRLFHDEISIHKNEKLQEMSEDYGQWITVLIALCTAGAPVELAETFSKLSNKHNDREFRTKWHSFQHYEKHSGGLECVLKEIGVHCDKPNTYTPDIVRDDKIINDLVPDILQYNVVALKATYGMGKTFGGLTPAVKYFKTKGKSQLTITEKVSLSYKLTGDFDFENYRNLKGNITAENVVVQLDSIHRLNRPYDVLYLDEFKGLLASFTNPTLRSKLGETFAQMIYLITNAEYIVISDADLDNYSLNIFETMFNKKVTKIEYTYKKMKGRKCHMTGKYESFVNDLLKDLDHKKKLFSPSQSAELSKQLFETVKIHNDKKETNLKLILITGNYTELVGYENPYPDNNASLKQHVLENFNYFCSTCDYITYTSTITSGVSYDDKTFDKCYAITSARSNSYRSFVQQLLRIRHVNSNEYEFFLSKGTKGSGSRIAPLYSYSYCEQLIRTSNEIANMTIDEIESLKILQCDIPKIDIHNRERHYNKFMEHVCINNMKERLDSKVYYFSMLCDLLEFHGFEIEFMNDDFKITTNTLETIETGKDKYNDKKEQMYIDIAGADDIKSEEEYENLKRKHCLNDEEYLKMTKRRIERKFNSCISPELVWLSFEKKHDMYLYKNQLGVLRKLNFINMNTLSDERDDFDTFLKSTDMQGEMQPKRQYYCNKILSVIGFSSIFDIMTRVNKRDVMQKLRDNIEWFQKMYQLHRVSYQKTTRINEPPCIEWTDEQLKYHVNTALQKEYGVSIVNATRSARKVCDEFKIHHDVISPLLFDFQACDTLGIDLRQMYVDARLNNTFDIICSQYTAYEEFIKARGSHKNCVDLIKKFKEYFQITNNEKDFVKSTDINEWIIEHNVNIEYCKFIKLLKEHCEANNLCKVQSKDKKITGKSVRIWLGIKQIST